MTLDEYGAPVPRPRRRSPFFITGAAIVLVVAILVAGRVRNVIAGPDGAVPACAWPAATIQGADADQSRLIRCYLKAIADRSPDGLRSVTPSSDDGGPTGFTDADFAHSADARSGTATVTVTVNTSDSADRKVDFHFANGAKDEREIHLVDPSSSRSWRFLGIGTAPVDPSAPSSAAG